MKLSQKIVLAMFGMVVCASFGQAMEESDPMQPGTVQKKLPVFEVKSEPGAASSDSNPSVDTREVALPSTSNNESGSKSGNSSLFGGSSRSSSSTSMRKEAHHSRSWLGPFQAQTGI